MKITIDKKEFTGNELDFIQSLDKDELKATLDTMLEVVQSIGAAYTDRGCDGMWAIANKMYEAFLGSEYDDVRRSEYDCLEDFVREQGMSFLFPDEEEEIARVSRKLGSGITERMYGELWD